MTLKTRLARCVATEDWKQAKVLAVLILEGVDDGIDAAHALERERERESEREKQANIASILDAAMTGIREVASEISQAINKPKSAAEVDADAMDSFYRGNFK